ncbi:MAG: hypothetical protein LAQ69_40220 [Acidobacteriia bacterium]|nr:hypothetical protein [Terriglobia bacterium]
MGRELYSGLATIQYNAGRDRDAFLSVLRLASPENREKIRVSLEPLLQSMGRFSGEQSARLQQAVDRRAAELGASLPVKAVAPAVDPRRSEASRIVVRRKRLGPVTLDDLPLDEREGFPGFAGSPSPLPLLTWCDGKRTLAEVVRLIEIEQGPMDFDFVGYFRFLARHGYADLVTPPAQ